MPNQRMPDAARTARRWVKGQTTRNTGARSAVALDIGQLISPLRLDVLVRASLFEAWATDWARLRTRPDEALALAQTHPYRTWFDSVAQFKITGGTDQSSPDEAFAWRVKRSHRLLDRYIESGFDQRRPITIKLHRGGEIRSGKAMGPRLYPVDGCHRLAMLWADGVRMLDPTLYRLLPIESPTRDNTQLLLSRLELSSADYFRFVGCGYGAHHVTTEDELLTAIHQGDPRRNELESVLAADRQIIDARRSTVALSTVEAQTTAADA